MSNLDENSESVDIDGETTSSVKSSPNVSRKDEDRVHEQMTSMSDGLAQSDERGKDPSPIERVRDDDELSTDEQEKQLEEELDDIDAIQIAQAELSAVPGIAEIAPRASVSQKKLNYLSKLPFFRKSKAPKKSDVRRVNFFELYRYADRWDVLLMIIGSLAAIVTGVLFVLLMVIYRRVTNNLADLGKEQKNYTNTSIVLDSPNSCFTIPDNSTAVKSPYDAIQEVVKYYVSLGFVSVFVYWVAWACWIATAERQVRRMRYILFRNILRQEIGWFDVHNPGKLSNRLIDDLDKIKDGINEKVPDFISLVTRTFAALIYALIVGWKLALVFMSVSPLIIIMFNVTVKMIVKLTVKEIQAFSSASTIAQEALQNIRTVTAFHGQKREEERFAKNLVTAKQMGLRKGFFMGLTQAISHILTFVAFTVTFWYGPQLIRTDCEHYSPGTLIVVFVSCMVSTTSASQLIPDFQNFAEALASAGYVFDIIDRRTKIDAFVDEGHQAQTIMGNIEFQNVTFTYPARANIPVLNHLSLRIPSGKTVALVGASGCGKSTAIQLIQRFYDPDEGQIFIDDINIKSLNVAWLRSHIGIVSQEPVLFTGSIEDNIRFGKPDATDDEVQVAAKMANAHDFIMELPENYKTLSGDKLSGGQKQRGRGEPVWTLMNESGIVRVVAIARALISNPKILLLDEATSALDNTSERVVQDALDRAKEGRTTIVIAHRLSTIRNADLIVGLERGQVVEYGGHDQLMEKRGLYYELVTAQTQKEEDKVVGLDSDMEDDEDAGQIVDQRSARRSVFKRSNVSADDLEDEDDLDNDHEPAANDPSKKKKNRDSRTPFIIKILQYNAPEWRWIVLGVAASLVYGAVRPIFAVFFSNVYGLFDNPDLNEQRRLANIYAGVIFLIGFVGGVMQFLSSIGFAKSGEELTKRMRILTFSAMLRQEMGYFDHEGNSVGALVTRLSADAAALKGLTGVRIGIIVQALSSLITALVVAFSAGWKLAFVIVCFVPIILFCGKVQGRQQSAANKSKSKSNSKSKSEDSFTEKAGQHATQAIEHIRTVVALHREQYFIDLYESAFNQEFKKQMCNLHFVAIGAGVANSLFYFLHCANFSFGSKLVTDGEMKYDEVLRVFVVITFAMMTVGRSMAMVPDYAKGKAAALRIMRLNDRQSQINPHDESGIILKDVIGNVQYQDVQFRYPSRPTLRVLKNFSLTCLSECTTALVGSSGSGKSTTIGLLQRFYEPVKGRVLLDGHDIKALNIRWLRSLIGLVQQEPVLFNLSIRENIAYGDNSREVTQEEVEKAARMANIHDLIVALPQGYETLCGTKGSQLSGGQKQRIAIARALVRSPKLLLLDEATSALDNQSEKVVQAALDNARSGRTCLTIAHRLSTIQRSEKIAVVDQGKMKEEGTHQELLNFGGIYAKLALSQQRQT